MSASTPGPVFRVRFDTPTYDQDLQRVRREGLTVGAVARSRRAGQALPSDPQRALGTRPGRGPRRRRAASLPVRRRLREPVDPRRDGHDLRLAWKHLLAQHAMDFLFGVQAAV